MSVEEPAKLPFLQQISCHQRIYFFFEKLLSRMFMIHVSIEHSASLQLTEKKMKKSKCFYSFPFPLQWSTKKVEGAENV